MVSVEAIFLRFLLVVDGITGWLRRKKYFPSFSHFFGWTTAQVLIAYAVFNVQVYLYHFIVICSSVNYLRLRLFEGYHIVNIFCNE